MKKILNSLYNKFKSEYNRPSSSIEFFLKEFNEISKNAIKIGPETFELFLNSYIFFISFDLKHNGVHFNKILESLDSLIYGAIKLESIEYIEKYVEKLSLINAELISYENFSGLTTFIISLRKLIQNTLQINDKIKIEIFNNILSEIKDIFSYTLRFSKDNIKNEDSYKKSLLEHLINNHRYIGYTLISREEMSLFNDYLDRLENIYLRISEIGSDYYSYDTPKEIDFTKKIELTRRNIKYEFHIMLFQLSIFSLNERKDNFMAKILSKDEIGRSISLVNREIYEDFIKDIQPEKYTEKGLQNPIRTIGEIGKFPPESIIVQVYLLLRSKAFFVELKKKNSKIWDFPTEELKQFLQNNYKWLFFDEEKPEEYREWNQIEFISEYIHEIKQLKTQKIKDYSCILNVIGILDRYNTRKNLFKQASENFTSNNIISIEAFGGALEEFLSITLAFLEKVNNVWKTEKIEVIRNLPLDNERIEKAKNQIQEGLNRKSIFRNAIDWKEISIEKLEETDKILDDIILKTLIPAKPLKNLPIIAFYDTIGEKAAQIEDEKIFKFIFENKIKERNDMPNLSIEKVQSYVNELNCDSTIIITSHNFLRDFINNNEIKYLKRINRAYLLILENEKIVHIYQSQSLKNETLIFGKDEFIKICYINEIDINIHDPEEIEISKVQNKKDYKILEISQNRGLNIINYSNAILIKHNTKDQ